MTNASYKNRKAGIYLQLMCVSMQNLYF